MKLASKRNYAKGSNRKSAILQPFGGKMALETAVIDPVKIGN
jgi:hypothetical protein